MGGSTVQRRNLTATLKLDNNIFVCLLVVTLAVLTFNARSAIAEWDLNETKPGGPFKEILDYDILVNCILLMEVYSFR